MRPSFPLSWVHMCLFCTINMFVFNYTVIHLTICWDFAKDCDITNWDGNGDLLTVSEYAVELNHECNKYHNKNRDTTKLD